MKWFGTDALQQCELGPFTLRVVYAGSARYWWAVVVGDRYFTRSQDLASDEAWCTSAEQAKGEVKAKLGQMLISVLRELADDEEEPT